MDIKNKTLLDIVEMIKTRKVSCVNVLENVLNNIENSETSINAYITIDRDKAYKKAKEVDNKIALGKKIGKLCGIPIAIKDNICVKNIKTTCGSKMLYNYIPTYDATVVELLEQEDAIIIGKTNMDEFGMGNTTKTSAYKITKNPLDNNRIAGGSSGGSAAALAAGECLCALGTDTGGSIRQPSAYCGVVGIKPTYGMVSRNGLIAYASSLDQIGPITKSVQDAAYMLDIIAKYDKRDSTSVDMKENAVVKSYMSCLGENIQGMKVAIPINYLEEGLDREIRESILKAADLLRKKGVIVEEIDFNMNEIALSTYYTIACAEASSNLARYDGVKYGYREEQYMDSRCNLGALNDMYRKSRAKGFGTEVKRRIMLGTFVLSSGYYDKYYLKAMQIRDEIKNEYSKVFKKYDVILSPITQTVAPRLDILDESNIKSYYSDIYSVGVNLAELPAISIPSGMYSQDMPIGIQFIGDRFREDNILRVAYSYEQSIKTI